MRQPFFWLAVILSLVTSFVTASVIPADTLHVPGQYQQIQVAILSASDGDTILVADGTYRGNGNRDIDFIGKAIVLMSENGPRYTVIDCEGDFINYHRGFNFHSGEGPDSEVRGFTVTGGWSDDGGAFYINQSSPTITGNWIINNTASETSVGYGGGVYSYKSASVFTKNVFSGNVTNGNGGGIYFYDSTPILDSNTFTANEASYYGGGFYCIYNQSTTVIHTILWDNNALDGESFYIDTGASITVSYSDVDGGWPGEGNISAIPEFVLSDRSDYRLLWESPCIDAGQPGSFDQDGTVTDIGAFFFDQDDLLTIYLTPDGRQIQRGSQFGITYTLINRQPQVTPFWILSMVIFPNSSILPVLGPFQYNVPGSTTFQVPINHLIPQVTPLAGYKYLTWIGDPPSTLYDFDDFRFEVVD